MDGFGLSDKELNKLIKKVESISGLERLLSVAVKGQPKIMHTFYKVNGIVIEHDELDNCDLDSIEKETIELNENKMKLADTKSEFKELLEQRLKNHNIQFDHVSKCNIVIQDLIDEVNDAKKLYQKERKKERMALDVELVDTSNRFVDFLDSFLTSSVSDAGEVSKNKKEPPFYLEIGAMFAQGFITQQRRHFYYKDIEFDSVSDLSRHIQSDKVLNTSKSTRQYLNDTLNCSGQKNFYASKTMMNKIVDYCNSKGIEITDDFKKKCEQLKKH